MTGLWTVSPGTRFHSSNCGVLIELTTRLALDSTDWIAKLCSSRNWSKAIRILDKLLSKSCSIQDIWFRSHLSAWFSPDNGSLENISYMREFTSGAAGSVHLAFQRL